MPTISDADLFECTSLVYNKWSDAFEAHKAAKSETNDGSLDWDAFHTMRLERTKLELTKWQALRDRLVPLNKPLI